MNHTIKVTEVAAHVWEWTVSTETELLGSGYCRTKRDAVNDATIFARNK